MDRYFRHVWIPDESYYQTLVRNYGRRIESRSLTLSKFDFQGKPHVFYDDHLHLLRRSDCFVARKVWPRADRLYRTFLSAEQTVARGWRNRRRARSTVCFPRRWNGARGGGRAVHAQPLSQPGWENGITAGPYSVFHGFNDLFLDFEGWLVPQVGSSGARQHLRPAPGAVHRRCGRLRGRPFCVGEAQGLQSRGFPDQPDLEHAGERQVFMFGPQDNQRPGVFMANDDNAQISVITGAWAVRLFASNRNFSHIRSEAARLQRTEAEFIETLRDRSVGPISGSGRWPISLKSRWKTCRVSSTRWRVRRSSA
jgi:hypothetical protein